MVENTGSVESYRITPLMQAVAARCPDGDLYSILDYQYHVKSLSSKEVGENLGISKQAIISWMRKMDIELRTGAEGTRVFYSDPIKKASAMAKVHSPEANKLRERAVGDFYQKHQELRRLGGISSMRSTQRASQAFGEHPKVEVRVKRHAHNFRVVKNLPPVEIIQEAQALGIFYALSPRQQEILLARTGLNGQAPKTLEELRDGVTKEAIRQQQARGLKKIRSLLGY